MSDDEFYICDRCGEEAADAPGALCLACFDDDMPDEPEGEDR